MNKNSKLILVSAAFIVALMMLVPLSQVNMPGGGGDSSSDKMKDCNNLNLSAGYETSFYINEPFESPSGEIRLSSGFDVYITEENFPDVNFRRYLKEVFNKDLNDHFSQNEILQITKINISNKQITNLKGIEYFTALKELNCSNNSLYTLDLSNNLKLSILDCPGNHLTSLNLSNNEKLIVINCYGNYLTSLSLGNNTTLTHLNCYDNYLTSLSLGNNTTLTHLNCYDNYLTSLDLKSNVNLEHLNCTDNYISSLDLASNIDLNEIECGGQICIAKLSESGGTWIFDMNAIVEKDDLTHIQNLSLGSLNAESGIITFDSKPDSLTYNYNVSALNNSDGLMDVTIFFIDAAETNGVKINETNFPDSKFREYVKIFDKDIDGSISSDEIKSILKLNISNEPDITSLQGIEHFTYLIGLNCVDGGLTSLNVSKNTELRYLNFYCNGISSLDLTNNIHLVHLICNDNNLTSLDLSKNKKLSMLDCYNNNLTSLDLSHNTSLSILNCNSNYLRFLDTSNNRELISLDCDSNNLTSLDLSNNLALSMLNCSFNNLTSLDLSSNKNLIGLICNDCGLYSLDLNSNTKLIGLECDTNYLTSLNLSNNMNLELLNCDSNNLTSLDLSNNLALSMLNCSFNNLTSLDLSSNTSLAELTCYHNNLTSLDLSNNPVLSMLNCSFNNLTSLDLSNNPVLSMLNCSFNNLTSLDLSNNVALSELACHYNHLTSLDLSKNVTLTEMRYYDQTHTAKLSESGGTWIFDMNAIVEKDDLTHIQNLSLGSLNAESGIITFDSKPDSLTYNYNVSALNNSDGLMDVTIFFIDAAETNGVKINETNFPDSNFREYVKALFNKQDNETLSQEELECVIDLDVSNKEISSLKGIEYFTALMVLDCSNNHLTSLDLSKNTVLFALDCSNNHLTSLDLSKNIALAELYCPNNFLKSLNTNNCTYLIYLICNNNYLMSLDLSDNTALAELNCESNYLTSLDLSKNIELTYLFCESNYLTSLDLTENKSLYECKCGGHILVAELSGTEGNWTFDMTALVEQTNLANISLIDIDNSLLDNMGVIHFINRPISLTYAYNTQGGKSNDQSMIVTLKFDTNGLEKCTITSNVNSGGSITPSGEIEVVKGTSQTFTIKPNTGYTISEIIVDGNEVQLVHGEYKFLNVTSNHSISATFQNTSSPSVTPPVNPPVTPTEPDEPKIDNDEIKNDDGTTSSITETTTKKENADGSKETTVKKDEVVKDESGKTQAVKEEITKTTENKDGSKETVVEKKEEVKDESGKTQTVKEEKHSEVVSKDGSVNKTSETTVKDSAGKVVEAKTEVKIEDKNTGVSTSAEITKDSSGKTTSEIKTEASIETKDGKAEVNSKTLDEALKQAEAAKKTVEEKGVKDVTPVIEINAEKSKDFTETQIAADDLSKLAEAEVEVKIKTATGEVNLPPEVSKNLSSNKDEKVSLAFGEADKNKLTEEQKKTVGNAPVFEFNLKSGENEIHDLGGTAKVTVPYELKKGEDANKITVWYVDESGKPVAMNSVYDPETKSITFETSHFSYYFIAEDAAIQDDKKDDSGNNTIYYAVAAVIIILIIIALAYYFMKKKQ